MLKTVFAALTVGLFLIVPNVYSQDIIHDAEYAIIEAQNGEQWAKDDQAIDIMLADIREKNSGKPPNIVYILLDDVGFGEIGMDNLSVIRGYKTPHMNSLAE
jgi:arylsulfatase